MDNKALIQQANSPVPLVMIRKFVGVLKDGAFDGSGILHFPGGQFRGVWRKGKTVSGDYFFGDDLKYEDTPEWDYCDGKEDRRFHSERVSGKINAAGDLQYTDKHGRNENLRDGCYDAGDGYLDIRDGMIHSYDKKDENAPNNEFDPKW